MYSVLIVKIIIGNSTHRVGRLILASNNDAKDFASTLKLLSLPVKIGICLAILIIFVVLVAGIILYRRQAREKDRVQKDMQNKMDMLEAKVAKECKEGETKT